MHFKTNSLETSAVQELERLRVAMQAGGIGSWKCSMSEGALELCEKGHALLGLQDSGIQPSIQTILAALHPEDSKRVHDEFLVALGRSGQFSIEGRVRWPDGSSHRLMVAGQTAPDQHGQPSSAVGIIRKVSEPEGAITPEFDPASNEADRQRELVRRLVENAPIGIAVIDARSRCYVLANAKYEVNAGPMITPGCFIGRRLGDFAPPQLAKFMHMVLDRVVATRKSFSVRNFETSFGAGREHTWWDNDVVPLVDEQGNVDSVLAITNEVTQEVLARKRIEELAAQMQAGRDELEAVINSMSEGVVVIEPNGRVVSANPAALKLHGAPSLAELPENMAEYAKVFEMLHADGRPLHVSDWPIMDAIKGQPVVNMELSGRRLDTGQTWVASYSITPVRNRSGQVSLLVVAIYDLTPIKQAERHLRQLMAELERSNNDLEQFAYVASHDLQEPLRMISGFMTLLREHYEHTLDERAKEYIAYAVDGSNRMQALIQGLLRYSRISSRGQAFTSISMQEVYERALADLHAQITASSATVTHDPLPEVVGDETQLVQVFLNLIGNALKFKSADRLPVVHVGAARRNGGWQFYVRDNGIGIDPEQYGRVFQLFQRLHNFEDFEGTGIGLALVKKIIERHGGSIWVESEPGQGSTFYFTLLCNGSDGQQ